jgi:hypothetical protein
MSLYRGAGGASDATDDSTVNAVAGYASAAASSASSAATSATNASNSATAAASSASSAASSASSVATNATNASNSAGLANTYATAANNSKNAAAASATTASTKAAEASSSASNAASSASSAGNYATAASESATQAGIYQGAASGYASDAQSYAQAALNIYGSSLAVAAAVADASGSASISSMNANDAVDARILAEAAVAGASSYASAAQGSANSAQSYATAALSARDATLAAYDSFDDRYLGVKSADPTVDNDGNPLIAGSLYFNDQTNMMMLRAGGVWVAAYTSGGSPSFGDTTVNGNLSVTGNTTLGDASTDTVRVNGNMGLGVTPSAWSTGSFTPFQIGAGASLAGRSSGTASPLDEVYLSANVYNDGSWKYIGAAAATQYYQDAGTHVWRYAASGAAGSAITFTTAMALSAAGNLGIGTTSPASRLHVESTGAVPVQFTSTQATAYLQINNSTQSAGIASTGSNLLFFTSSSGTERARIDSAGNLGLGVTPSAWWSSVSALQVKGAALLSSGVTSSSVANAYLNSSAAWTYYGTGNATHYEQTLGQHRWYTAASGTAGNAITFTQAMTLDASGNLGIGTTSPSSKLDVSATGADSVFSQTVSGVQRWQTKVESATGNWLLHNQTAAATRLTVNTSGSLGIGVTPNVWSSSWGALQLTGGMAVAGTAGYSCIGQNWYSNSGSKYIATGNATLYEQNNGQHRWYNAPSGTAGNAITFTQALAVDASGNLLVGATAAGTSAAKVIGLANATAPTTSPAGMGQLYVEGGALKYRGSSGTVTTIAAA